MSRPKHSLLGLHHVTATVGQAQADLDFCLDGLGLRLVKRTVNFDNHNVYHFYYGDERGTPGSLWTTFPYSGWGVAQGLKGEGQIGVTAFSVPADSLEYWRERLGERGIRAEPGAGRFGEESLEVDDPSGLRIELVGAAEDDRPPWSGSGVPAGAAIRGLHGVTMVVADPGPTVGLMTGLLGFTVVGETAGAIRLAMNGHRPGRIIEVLYGTGAGPARNGIGTVHHVAMAIADAGEQLRLRQELLDLGRGVTEVRDRQYFQSIYFREPGGVLFEVATVGPGFLVDEPLEQLGHGLKLPPWEEPQRAAIEAGLPEIRSPALSGNRTPR
jgi:glyoxalase family protein